MMATTDTPTLGELRQIGRRLRVHAKALEVHPHAILVSARLYPRFREIMARPQRPAFTDSCSAPLQTGDLRCLPIYVYRTSEERCRFLFELHERRQRVMEITD